MKELVPMESTIIAIDPGREKCGVAVVRSPNRVLLKEVVSTPELTSFVQRLISEFKTTQIVLGDRTSSQAAQKKLNALLVNGKDPDIALVDEHKSTDAARKRYWEENPPAGFRRLIPTSMQVPPGPVDDYVAVILAERYFSAQGKIKSCDSSKT